MPGVLVRRGEGRARREEGMAVEAGTDGHSHRQGCSEPAEQRQILPCVCGSEDLPTPRLRLRCWMGTRRVSSRKSDNTCSASGF